MLACRALGHPLCFWQWKKTINCRQAQSVWTHTREKHFAWFSTDRQTEREQGRQTSRARGRDFTWLLNEGKQECRLRGPRRLSSMLNFSLFVSHVLQHIFNGTEQEHLKHTQKQTEEWNERPVLHSWWTDVSPGHHPIALLRYGMHQREGKRCEQKVWILENQTQTPLKLKL